MWRKSRSRILRTAKPVFLLMWIVVIGSVFALLMTGAAYFAWEQGWIQFGLNALILALIALLVAGAITYWSEHR
jgi:hypothetical protein